MALTLHIAGASLELADYESSENVIAQLESSTPRRVYFYLANGGNVRLQLGADATSWALEETP